MIRNNKKEKRKLAAALPSWLVGAKEVRRKLRVKWMLRVQVLSGVGGGKVDRGERKEKGSCGPVVV